MNKPAICIYQNEDADKMRSNCAAEQALVIYIYIIYNGEIKMYFYLAMVGFEPTPTATAAPSNTETTVITSRPLRSLKK